MIFFFRMMFVNRCTMEKEKIETQSERPRAGRDTEQLASFARGSLTRAHPEPSGFARLRSSKGKRDGAR